MKKLLLGIFLAAISFGVSAEESILPFHWKYIGGDPCNPEVGCTAQWALGQTDWPGKVQGALLTLKAYEPARPGIICAGWTGWMTWGKNTPKFKPYVIAAWPDGHCEPIRYWEVRFEGDTYVLAQVKLCGNWGGWVEKHPIAPVLQPKLPLGYIPTVYCE